MAQYKVLVWIEDNGVSHSIRMDDEQFNFLDEDEESWRTAYKKEFGDRTLDNVMKVILEYGYPYRVVKFNNKA